MAIFFIGLLTFASGTSHPFHVSVAEVEYNPQSKKLECSLRVWPNDLEKALNQNATETVDLDKTKDIDKLIHAYLKKRIKISDGKKEKTLTWVGKEIEVKKAWLYFEIETDGPPVNLTFSNQIFFELQEDQINLFNLKNGNRRASISFSKTKESHKLVDKDFIPIQNPFANRKPIGKTE